MDVVFIALQRTLTWEIDPKLTEPKSENTLNTLGVKCSLANKLLGLQLIWSIRYWKINVPKRRSCK